MVKRIALRTAEWFAFAFVWFGLMPCSAFCQDSSLPDAPSTVIASEAHRDLTLPKAPADMEAVAPPPSQAAVYEPAPAAKDSELLTRLLNPDRSWQHTRYQPSDRDTVIGRATDAASRIFVSRDESGRRHVNTSYFVVVLTSVAAQRAERPYWLRSNSAAAPLTNVGSTFGNDAGMNLLHEFGPSLRQAVTGHLPGFVYKIQERITHQMASR